jgi:hypothetical protein
LVLSEAAARRVRRTGPSPRLQAALKPTLRRARAKSRQIPTDASSPFERNRCQRRTSIAPQTAPSKDSLSLCRTLIDQSGTRKGELHHGEPKSIQTDRVVLVTGPEHEADDVLRLRPDPGPREVHGCPAFKRKTQETCVQMAGRSTIFGTRLARYLKSNLLRPVAFSAIAAPRQSSCSHERFKAIPIAAALQSIWTRCSQIVAKMDIPRGKLAPNPLQR